jgi:hypothetical protein
MCKDKKMLALIMAIFVMVLFITGWVFADHSVMDLITVTPIFEARNTAPAPVVFSDAAVINIPASNTGMCTLDSICE